MRSKTPNTPTGGRRPLILLEWDFVLFFIVLHPRPRAQSRGRGGGWIRRRENERRATPKQAAKGSKQSCVSRTPLSCQVLAPSRAVARSVRGRRKTTLPRTRWGPGLRASWQHPLHGGGGAGRPGSTMQWSVLHCRAEDRESHLPGTDISAAKNRACTPFLFFFPGILKGLKFFQEGFGVFWGSRWKPCTRFWEFQVPLLKVEVPQGST